MVISHNRLIGGKQGSPTCTGLCAASLSNPHESLRYTKQVQITLADPVFDPNARLVGNSSVAPSRCPGQSRSQSNCSSPFATMSLIAAATSLSLHGQDLNAT